MPSTNGTTAEKPRYAMPASGELGTPGLRLFGGRVFEEFLTELRGPQGVKVYQQMRWNDPMIGAVLRATKDTIQSVKWGVESVSESSKDLKNAEFVLSCMNDMSHTWREMIGESLTMLPFGWAFMEVCYKPRMGDLEEYESRFTDGRIGWRKIALRGQETLQKWEIDDHGGIKGMWQQALTPQSTFQTIFIPIEKSILFRTEKEKNNPEGFSYLRNAYTAYYKKSNLEEIEAIAAERDATGALMITPPVGADDSDKAAAQEIMERWKVDDQFSLYLPRTGKEEYEMWKADIIKSAGERSVDLDKSIQRYQGEIAMAFLAQFLRLGQSGAKVGSYALSRDQKDLFHLSVKSVLDNIEETVNRFLVPLLMKLNGITGEPPRIIHGRIGQRDLQTLALFLSNLSNIGAFVPDTNLRQFLREEAELPREPEGLDVDENVVVRQKQEEEPTVRDRTGEKPRSVDQPQEQGVKRDDQEMSEFELTDEIFAAAAKRKERLYRDA